MGLWGRKAFSLAQGAAGLTCQGQVWLMGPMGPDAVTSTPSWHKVPLAR